MLLKINIPLQIVEQLRLDYPGLNFGTSENNPALLIDTDLKEQFLRWMLDELSAQIARDRELLSKINDFSL